MARFAVEILVSERGLAAVGATARGQVAGVQSLGNSLFGVEVSLKGLARLAAQAFAGFTAISIGRQLITEIKDSQAAFAQLEAGVRSTGGAAGYTAEQLDEMAGAMSKLVGVDDEVIAGGLALLLTFRRIGGEAFPQAMRAALDLSARFGKDLNSSVVMVGKALELPKSGIAALARAGVQFSPIQKELISNLVETGKQAEAQQIILKELEIQFGGSAAAARDTLGGALTALKTSWGNLLERVGSGGGTFRQVIEGMGKALDWLTDHWHMVEGAVYAVLAGITGAIGANVTLWLAAFERVAKVAEGFIRLNPFNNDKTKAAAAAALATISNLKKDFGGGLLATAEGFAEKSKEAFMAVGKSVRGLSADFHGLVEETAGLSDAQKKVLGDVSNSIAALELQARNAERALRAAIQGREAHKAELLTQKIAAAILTEEGKLREHNLKLTTAQRDAIEESIRSTEKFKNLTDLLVSSWKNLSGLKPIEIKFDVSSIAKIPTMAIEGFDSERSIDEWNQFGNAIRAGLRTAAENAQLYITDVAKAVEIGALTAEEAERELARVRSELLQQTLSEWGNFFSALESLFGGALGKIAGKISNMINDIQQAYQAGQSLSTGLGNMGVAGGTASAVGGAVGGIMIMAVVLRAIYDIRKAQKEADRMRQYYYAAAVSMGGTQSGIGFLRGGRPGEWSNIAPSTQAREASRAIQEAAEALAEAMGGVLQTFARLEIKVRADGKYFQAFIEGEFVGKFESFAAAMDAALLGAFRSARTTLRGLGELVQQGLEQFRSVGTAGSSAAELQQWLGSLREIAQLNWSAEAQGVSETVRHLDELWTALMKLKEVTPAVIEGFGNLITAEVSAWTAWRRSITGDKEKPEEQLARLRAEAQIFNAQKALRIAELKLRYEELKIQQQQLEARGQIVIAGGGIGRGEIEIGREYLKARAELAKVEASIYQAQLDALAAAMEAILQLIAALEAIPDIDIAGIKLPRVGGGGGDARGTARDHLADLRARSIGETAVINLEFTRSLAAWREEARAGKLTAADLAEGERLLREERDRAIQVRRTGLFADVAAFGGVSPFAAVKNDANDLRNALRAALKDGTIKWREFKTEMDRLNAAERERLHILEQEMLVGTMEGLAKYVTDETLRIQLLQDAAVIKFQLEYANLIAQTELLRLQGVNVANLDAAIRDIGDNLPAILDRIRRNLDPRLQTRDAIQNTIRERREEERRAREEEARQAREAAERILKDWQAVGKHPIHRELDEFARDLLILRRGLGDTAETAAAAAAKLNDIIARYLNPIREYRQGLQFSELSTLTGEQQFFASQQAFRDALMAVQGGDLTKLEDITALAQQYGELARGYTAGSGFRFIMSEIQGALAGLEALIPGWATSYVNEQLGSATRPMVVDDTGMVSAAKDTTNAINTGNDLMLDEMRQMRTKLHNIDNSTGMLYSINDRLTGTLSVRNVA